MTQAQQNKNRLQEEMMFNVITEAIEDATFIASTLDDKTSQFMWDDGSYSVYTRNEIIVGDEAKNFRGLVSVEDRIIIENKEIEARITFGNSYE